MTQLFPRIRRVAVAITISPRMVAVLAAAWHFTERLNAPLLVIHGGAPAAQKEAEFRDAMFLLRALKDHRYDGWLVVEQDTTPLNPTTIARENRLYLEALLKSENPIG
jgi:hypothetical protein